MASSMYSYDGSRGLTSPLLVFGASVNASSDLQPPAYFADDDDVLNGASTSHSNNDFFDVVPSASPPIQHSSYPPSPRVNSDDTSFYGKITPGTPHRARGSGRLARRSQDGMRVSSNAVLATSRDGFSPTPQTSVQARQESSDRYDYGGTLGNGAALSVSDSRGKWDKLPAVSSGVGSHRSQRRGSASSLASSLESLIRGNHTAPLATKTSPAAALNGVPLTGSVSRLTSSSGTSQRTPQPPLAAAKAESGMGDYWIGDVSEVLPQSPRAPFHESGTTVAGSRSGGFVVQSSSSFSKRQPRLGRELDTRSLGQQMGSRRDGGGTRTATFFGVDDSPESSLTQYDRTLARGAENTHNKSSSGGHASDVSPSPTRALSASSRTAASASNRTQSDGDLRMRSTSRNSEQGGLSSHTTPAVQGSSGSIRPAEGRQRSASEPSPRTDEGNAYYPFGLAEMASTTMVDSPALPSSTGRLRGVVEVSSSTSAPSSRFKTFGKSPQQQQPVFVPRQIRSGFEKASASPERGHSPPISQPYDLDVVTGGTETKRGASIEYSLLLPSPQLKTKDVLEEGGYGDLNGLLVKEDTSSGHRVPTGKSSATKTATASQTNGVTRRASVSQHSVPAAAHAAHTVANGHSLASATAAVPPSSTTSTVSAPKHAPPSDAAAQPATRSSPFEPVSMTTSATPGSGRRFTFDGTKSLSPMTNSNGVSPSQATLGQQRTGATTGSGGAVEAVLESSDSLSHSASMRAPRPPSRRTANRADVVGAVVAVEADKLPSLSSRPAQRATAAVAKPFSGSPPNAAAKALSPISTNSMSNSTTLPPVTPSSRRQSINSATPHSGISASSTSTQHSPSSANSPASATTTKPPTPSHKDQIVPAAAVPPTRSRFIKATGATVATATNASRSTSSAGPAALDATLSPIASDHDSLDSLETAKQQALLQTALRAVQSSVQIRTNVDEAALLPRTNAPWPLRPPSAGILIQMRVFDPEHPLKRGPKTRELPNGQRQANWEPPETHYTTTLADLAAMEDEEEEEENGAAVQTDQAKLRAIQEFEDEIWAGEDVDVSPQDSLDSQMPQMSSASPMPPTLLRGVTVLTSGNRTAKDGVESPPVTSPQRSATITLSPSTRSRSGLATFSADALSFTPLPPPSTLHDSAALEVSLNASLNPTKRYGGIVVDEVEKVRRMREDSVFTPVLDDLDGEASSSSRRTPFSSTSERANAAAANAARQPFRSPHSEASTATTSPRRTRSPMPLSRGFKTRPLSPRMREGETPPYVFTFNSSNSNTTSLSNRAVGAGGVHNSLSEANPHSLQSEQKDTLVLDAEGNPAVPQSPAAPTFARIIAQRSGGGGGTGNLHPPGASLGIGNQSASRDSLYSAFGQTLMSGVTSSFGDRKSMVTFAEDELSSTPRRQR